MRRWLPQALGLAVSLSLGLGLTGCDSADQSMMDMAPAASQLGTVTVRFKVSDWVRQNVSPTSTLKGSIYGDLYLSEDVTLMGPLKGAPAADSIAVTGVDLKADMESSMTWKSKPLPPERYTFLGFFDIDDKSTPQARMPQAGDPVTLPVTNRFLISADQNLDGSVVFDLIYN